MKKKLLIAIALVLCLAVCAVVLVTCQNADGAVTISLDRTSLTIALDGEPVTLVASLSEGEGSFTWESSSPDVASIDQNGTVTPVSKGTATITVKCGTLAPATCEVTVGAPLHTPVFQADAMGLGIVVALNKGETYQIIDTVTYNGAAVEVPVRFTSADESVAKVSEMGLITAVAMGSSEIKVTAEYLGVAIEMTVTVAVQSDISFTAATAQAVPLTKRVTGKCITLIDPDKQIESKSISVKLVRAQETASAAKITWEIADSGDAYVRLSATTGESVTVTALSPGETTVLATTTIDGTKYTVAFGIAVEEGAYLVLHTDNGKAAGKTACDGICDVCGKKIPVTHADKNRDCLCDYCGAVIHSDVKFDGICDNNSAHDLRVRLTEENAGTPELFAKTVAANAGKYIILIENLDWSGEGKADLFGDTYGEYTSVDAISDLRGALDGQGHIISGFRLGHSGAGNYSAMFLKNSGIIRNIGFVFTLATANSSQTGIVLENTGLIENVFVDVTANARSWATGPIAGVSTGTIRNCISLINEASTGKGGHLAGMVGAYRGGSIQNCYAIGNGHTTTQNAYTECFSGISKPVYTQYASNNKLLAALKTLPAGNGWASSWSVTKDGIKFGGSLVIPYTCDHVDSGSKKGTTACDGVCDLCSEKVQLPHADKNKDCVCDYCRSVTHTDANFNGICDYNSKHDLRVRLTKQNAGTPALFAKTVAENADKYLLLTENLSWGGTGTADLFGDTYSEYTTVDAIASFSGVLDGNGHIISGFRLGHSGEMNDSAIFLENSGTIKNIGFQFTLATANSGQTGIVRDNTGTIENVFVDITANARSWATGAVAGISTGTVRNCIALINEASTGKGGNLAGVVGAYRDGSIKNCYAIGNGHTTTTNAYTECFGGLAKPGYTHYASNNKLLAAVKTLPAANGWASSWSVTKDGIKFGGQLVIKYICEHVDNGSTKGSTACDGICDLCGEKVTVTHVDKNGDCHCDYCTATLHTDVNSDGICDNNAAHDFRIRLTKENAGTPALFATIVAENADKYLLLTENLDWSGEGKANLFGNTFNEFTSVAAIANFSGVLDGNGHIISGFRLGHSSSGNISAMFLENSGTIKNIGFIYTLATANTGHTGIVNSNSGIIDNVFVDVTVNARCWSTGTVAGISTGVIRNCIVVINEASAGQGGRLAGIVGAFREGSIKNCYAIGNGHPTTTDAYTECFGGLANPDYKLYDGNNALLEALTEFSTAKGWASFWSVTDDGIKFGSQLVIARICAHADDGKTAGTTACDGICDLCGEQVSVTHADEDRDCTCDYCGTNLHTDANSDGVCDNNSEHVLSVRLNKQNAGTPALFAQTVAENSDKYMILVENLDWSGEGKANLFGDTYSEFTGIAAIAELSGTLDGNGHIISGFRLGHSLPNYDSAMFLKNSGTIKNIGFVFTLETANSGQTGLVRENTGTIENVFVDITANKRSWTTGTVAGISTGTIRNCIAVINKASTSTEGNLAGIVGAYRGGSIKDCYAIGNGKATTENAYTECFGGLATPVYTLYKDSNALLAGVTDLSTANGWASSWSVSSDGISFGGKVVIAAGAGAACQHTDVSPADGKCDLCGESVATAQDTYYISKTTAATVADFVALINADLDGTYYLTEDLDYSANAVNTKGIKDFAGVLDGQGHTVKGIKIQYNSNNAYATNLFKSNSGTIQNIAFEYSIVDANGSQNALISTNTGTVQNVYAKATVTKVRTQGYNSPFVANNSGATAVVKNCIVDVTVAASITSLDGSHGAVVSLNNEGAVVQNCYYKVTGVSMPGIAYPWGGVNSTAVLNSSVTSLPAADGWSSYWTISSSGVKFG